MPDIYLGDVGVIFNIDTESTMTGLTTGHIDFRVSDGSFLVALVTTHATEETYLTFTATSTNWLFTTTQQHGDWTGQAHITLGAASSISLHGAPFIIKVGEAINMV